MFDYRHFNVYAHLFLGLGYGLLRVKVMSNEKKANVWNNKSSN